MQADEDEAAYGGAFVFDFFEEVEIVGGNALPVGSRVAVLGHARDEDGVEWYSVAPLGGECWSARGDHMRSTGKRFRREDFYDGSTIRVSPTGDLLND